MLVRFIGEAQHVTYASQKAYYSMNAIRKLIREIESWMNIGRLTKAETRRLKAYRHKLLKQLLRIQLKDWHKNENTS